MLERTHRIVLLSVAVAGLILGSVGSWRTAAPVFAASSLTIFVAPSNKGGADAHSGLSRSSPLLTLHQAQVVLATLKPATDVVVDILQGDYTVGETDWDLYIPGHTISFIADGYVFGGGRPAAGDPVFTNISARPAAWWFKAVLPSPTSPTFSNGGTTGLRFYYLLVRDYTGGISFDGQSGRTAQNNQTPPMYIKPSLGIDGNTVEGMTFERIGDAFTPAGWFGLGAILLTDSSNNVIDNNTFDQIENSSSRGPDQIHGIYMTHFSSSNSVTRNRFTSLPSYPVKVRDRSNFNDVDNNTLSGTGGLGTGGPSTFRDEFCTRACATANHQAWQCPSYGNTFSNNSLGTVFGSTAHQVAWTMDPPGETNSGDAGCSIPSGLVRVSGSGNV